MRIPMMLVCRTALIYCLAASLPVVAQSTQQKPSTRPAPAPRPSKPGGDVSIQPYPNPPKPGPTPRPPGQNPGQRPPGTNPGSNPGARPPSRPPSRPTGDVTIQPYPYPPKPGPRPPRPPTWGRPPQYRPPYQWRPGDWDYLHRYYYRNLGYINRSRRPVWIVGGFIPWTDFGYLTPLPPNLYGYLPPPPPGYQVAYYQGYVVVYDPRTGFIVNVVDLLR